MTSYEFCVEVNRLFNEHPYVWKCFSLSPNLIIKWTDVNGAVHIANSLSELEAQLIEL